MLARISFENELDESICDENIIASLSSKEIRIHESFEMIKMESKEKLNIF